MKTRHRLKFAPRVTRRHGTIFMQSLFYAASRGGVLYDAFSLTGLIEWPDEEQNDTPAKLRYESIEDEILRRTVSEVEDSIAAAFVRIAREVIERENRRQHGGKKGKP